MSVGSIGPETRFRVSITIELKIGQKVTKEVTNVPVNTTPDGKELLIRGWSIPSIIQDFKLMLKGLSLREPQLQGTARLDFKGYAMILQRDLRRIDPNVKVYSSIPKKYIGKTDTIMWWAWEGESEWLYISYNITQGSETSLQHLYFKHGSFHTSTSGWFYGNLSDNEITKFLKEIVAHLASTSARKTASLENVVTRYYSALTNGSAPTLGTIR